MQLNLKVYTEWPPKNSKIKTNPSDNDSANRYRLLHFFYNYWTKRRSVVHNYIFMVSKFTLSVKWMGVILLTLLLAATVNSCKEDPAYDSALIGTWKSFDADGDPWTLTFRKDQTGTLNVSYETRATITISENFTWATSADSGGNKWLDIIHSSGDDILGTDSYLYIVTGKQLSLGDLIFSR